MRLKLLDFGFLLHKNDLYKKKMKGAIGSKNPNMDSLILYGRIVIFLSELPQRPATIKKILRVS